MEQFFTTPFDHDINDAILALYKKLFLCQGKTNNTVHYSSNSYARGTKHYGIMY